MISKNKIAPTLRFDQFTTNYETKEIGLICNVATGSRDTKDAKEAGLFPFYVRSDSLKKIDTFSKNGEAILTSGDGVGVGRNFHYVNGKFDFHQRVYCLDNFKNGYLGKYVFHYFKEK